MTHIDWLLLSLLALPSFFVMGVSGAANAIVFNAAFLGLVNVGLIDVGSLHDALYWLALANLAGGILLGLLMRQRLVWDATIGRYLLGMLPATVVAALLLPALDPEALSLVLAPALLISGLVLAVGGLRERLTSRAALNAAIPAGIGAGVLSGLFGMGGPVTLLFFAATTEATSQFRSRVFVIGLITSGARASVLLGSGAVRWDDLTTFGATLPAIAGGIVLGHAVHPHVGPRAFALLLGALVLIASVTTLLRGIHLWSLLA